MTIELSESGSHHLQIRRESQHEERERVRGQLTGSNTKAIRTRSSTEYTIAGSQGTYTEAFH